LVHKPVPEGLGSAIPAMPRPPAHASSTAYRQPHHARMNSLRTGHEHKKKPPFTCCNLLCIKHYSSIGLIIGMVPLECARRTMQGKQGKHARTRHPLGVQERAHGDGACDDGVHLHPGHRVPLAATKVHLHKGLAGAYNDTPLKGLVRSRHRTHTREHTQVEGVQVAIVGLFERALVHAGHRIHMRHNCLSV
jgi:hypothetical protein